MGFFNIFIFIFFSIQFNNNYNKKFVKPMGSTQPNPTRVGWVGHSDGLGWVEFFFDPPWWVKSKNLLNLIQPDPCTPLSMSHL